MSNGSLTLSRKYSNDIEELISITGPDAPELPSSGEIVRLKTVAQSRNVVEKLDLDALFTIVKERLDHSLQVSSSESAFYAAMLIHSRGKSKIRRWGPRGWYHLREGDWVSLFRSIDPEEIVSESGGSETRSELP